jgi:hypothetical protein
MSEKVLDLLDEMVIEPNRFTLTTILSACANVKNNRAREIGQKYLDQIPNYFQNDIILMNTAIHMLMNFNDIERGEQLFEQIKNKDIVSYGALMKGNQLYIIL